MNNEIKNIYMFMSEEGKQSYIYSVRKQNDKLRYDYYILTKDEYNNPIIEEPINTIKLLEENGFKLTPIKQEKNNPEYELFLTNLSIAISNFSKKELLGRK